jgi:hypothetical protein
MNTSADTCGRWPATPAAIPGNAPLRCLPRLDARCPWRLASRRSPVRCRRSTRSQRRLRAAARFTGETRLPTCAPRRIRSSRRQSRASSTRACASSSI